MLSYVFVYVIVFPYSDHNCCPFPWVFLSLSHSLFSLSLLDVAGKEVGV